MAGALIQNGAVEVIVELYNFVSASWVDVTCDVDTAAGINLAAGATDDAGILTTWEAATCSFRLIGAEYDPFNGPYAAWAGPLTQVRVRYRPTAPSVAAWTTAHVRPPDSGSYWSAFTGRVTDDGWPYRGNHKLPARSFVDVVAADGTGKLADESWTANQSRDSLYTDDAPITAPDILGYVLNNGVPLSGPYYDNDIVPNLAGGPGYLAQYNGPTRLNNPMPDTSGLPGPYEEHNKWDDVQRIALADLGLAWFNRRNLFAYRPGGRVDAGPVTASLVVCAPTGDEVQLVDVDGNVPSVVANVVRVAHDVRVPSVDWPVVPTPNIAYIYDLTSVNRYGERIDERLDLLNFYDDQSWRIAYALLTNSTPNPAPAGVMLSTRADARAVGLLLSSELDNVYRMQDAEAVGWHRIAPVGWSVLINKSGVSGELYTFSLDRFVYAVWDDTASKWDDASTKWGV